jgi:hypothetical protein
MCASNYTSGQATAIQGHRMLLKFAFREETMSRINFKWFTSSEME